MAISAAPPDLTAARAALAAEWTAVAPETPDAIAAFYRTSQQQTPDLVAWHRTPERQQWTAILCAWAQQAGAARVVDIGCGLGHDLAALREALPAAVLTGVEPNIAQRRAVLDGRLVNDCVADVDAAPLESADFLVCIDVLEHVPDPEAFLGRIAQRAPLGCHLFEATATHHVSNPLHLRANVGWHPGRVLDRYGWQLRGDSHGETRVRIWERTVLAAPPRAGILVAAYRNVAAQTVQGLLECQAGPVPAAAVSHHGEPSTPTGTPCRVHIQAGDGLITRSRAIMLTRWWQECADDVALMVDDDIVFTGQDALRVIERCRELRSVVCGAYPVGDGSHFALRFWDHQGDVEFHPNAAPLNIEYGATGFMAIHRDVVDAIMATVDWVHEDAPWAFKPVFEVGSQPHGDVHFYVSEDWWFSQRVRELGFEIWCDPRVMLGHLKPMSLNVRNMGLAREMIAQT